MKYLYMVVLSFCAIPVYARHDVPATKELVVQGAVKHKLKFGESDLAHFAQDSIGDVVLTNKRGDRKGTMRQLKGVLLKTILDSAGIVMEKPKDYSELVIVLTASDGYRNVFSWNELYNTDIGNHVYIITEMDGQSINTMTDRILVVSLSDYRSGSRHLRGLAKIEVKKI